MTRTFKPSSASGKPGTFEDLVCELSDDLLPWEPGVQPKTLSTMYWKIPVAIMLVAAKICHNCYSPREWV